MINNAISFQTVQTTYEKLPKSMRYVSDHLIALALKVSDFVKRHSKAFFLYTSVALTLACFGITAPKIAVTLLPSFGYMLSFSDAEQFASDFLEEYILGKNKLTTWIPRVESEATSPALMKRYQTFEKVMGLLEYHSSLGSVFLHGKTRLGKSSCIDPLSELLVKRGHRVFALKAHETLKKGGGLRGEIDTRYVKIVLYLNCVAARSSKPPVLIVDSFSHLVNINDPLFMNSYKNDSGLFIRKFNILAIDETSEWEKLQEGVKSRFEGCIKYIKPLDEEGIVVTLSHVNQLERSEYQYILEKAKTFSLTGKILSMVGPRPTRDKIDHVINLMELTS